MEQNNNHREKMAAPIFITVILVVYYFVYFMFFMNVIESPAFSLLLGIIPLALGSVSIYVCIQRIKEIRSGEEDDLSQY